MSGTDSTTASPPPPKKAHLLRHLLVTSGPMKKAQTSGKVMIRVDALEDTCCILWHLEKKLISHSDGGGWADITGLSLSWGAPSGQTDYLLTNNTVGILVGHNFCYYTFNSLTLF